MIAVNAKEKTSVKYLQYRNTSAKEVLVLITTAELRLPRCISVEFACTGYMYVRLQSSKRL
jgi:hypothetical protein